MFKTIVIGLDGSYRCDSAVAAVISQAAPGARVVAVHAQTHAAEPVQTEVVHEQMERLQAAGLQVELDGNVTVMGDEANVIARVARRNDADVIVTATRGQVPLAGLLEGSVSQRLLHLADCPVLVIPPSVAQPQVAEKEKVA
jgi:nucleotide-binding universal stress UspA family protein